MMRRPDRPEDMSDADFAALEAAATKLSAEVLCLMGERLRDLPEGARSLPGVVGYLLPMLISAISAVGGNLISRAAVPGTVWDPEAEEAHETISRHLQRAAGTGFRAGLLAEVDTDEEGGA